MEIILFDVDGTLCESSKTISLQMARMLNNIIDKNIQIGIVGGGTFEKIIFQLDKQVNPQYIFSECGSVYHKLSPDSKSYILVNKNNLKLEPEYIKINKLIKSCLKFISDVDYLVSGHFIDLRNGLIYVSLVGMVGSDEERANFVELDKIHEYRLRLIELLKTESIELNIGDYIDISLGGSVGIAIYPKKWNKVQVLNWIDPQIHQIHYFGDKYLPNGNDYELISNSSVIPHPTDSPAQTYMILQKLIKKN